MLPAALRSVVRLGMGQGLSMTCTFLRSVIIARLVSPDNFGIAAVLALTHYLSEMGSNLGLETHLIQAANGNDKSFQKSAQFLQACRGLVNASLIFSLAGPVSVLFSIPQAEWAFRCLALTQLIKGFTHFDQYRFQRDMKFGPAIGVDIAGNLLSLIATIPLAWWLKDYSVMVWTLLVQAIAVVLGSHFVAQRRYGWILSLLHTKQIFSFGWPLMVNGLLLYGISQGEQFVIGSAQRLFPQSTLSLVDLAVYSIAFSITSAPTGLIASASTSILLPLLSKTQNHRELFVQRYQLYAKGIAVVAASISILFILAGGWLVTLIYGEQYKMAGTFIGWLAAMQSIRMVRVVPTMASIALGNTVDVMLTNTVRILALVGALIAAAANFGLAWIAAAGFAGDLLALTFLSMMLLRHHAIKPGLCLRPISIVIVAMVVVMLAIRGGITIIVVFVGLSLAGIFHQRFKDLFAQLREQIMNQEKPEPPAHDSVSSPVNETQLKEKF